MGVGGYFNEILKSDEKQGWLPRPERQVQLFREALDHYRLYGSWLHLANFHLVQS